MELDSLKNSWDKQSAKELKTSNENFMELIHHKSHGPVAILKNKFLQQLIAFPVFIAIMIYKFYTKPELLQDIKVWFFVAVGLALAAYFLFNFRIISRLQRKGASVKHSIEKDIDILENGFRKYFVVNALMLAVFIVLIEILMFYQKIPSIKAWFSYAIYIRIAVYIALVILNYVLARYSFKNQYGLHISHLKDLLSRID